jgi:hypothetical protein
LFYFPSKENPVVQSTNQIEHLAGTGLAVSEVDRAAISQTVYSALRCQSSRTSLKNEALMPISVAY